MPRRGCKGADYELGCHAVQQIGRWRVYVGVTRAGTGGSAGGLDVLLPTFEVVWREWRLPMLQLAVMLVDSREAAEDIVQDAFTGLHRAWPRVGNPPAYLRSAVVNRSRSLLRRRRVARAWVVPKGLPEPGADERVLIAEEHREVLAALRRLPHRQREVLVLQHWQGLCDAQIAELLGLAPASVRAAAARGRARLAEALQAEGRS